jgi:hypothetical protein
MGKKGKRGNYKSRKIEGQMEKETKKKEGTKFLMVYGTKKPKGSAETQNKIPVCVSLSIS